MAASVIIPAHNAEHCLPVQLAALARQDFAAAFEVVVVCNRCSDGTAPAAERFLGRLNIKVISADEKASAAYARNVGAQHAKGSLLLFCDADDQVSEAWVRSMVDALERGPADFVAGRLDVDRQGLPNWIYDWSYAWVDGKCLLGQGGGDLPFVSSAALGVTRSAFDSVGGFDERFSEAGGEDRDLSWRLFLAGARVGEAWSAGVRYTPRKTLGGLLHQQKAYARGRLAVDRKWGRIKRPVSRRVLTRRLASTAV